jgi:hypothetical protein
VVDPIEGEGVDERIRALGEPAGMLVLLDRHRRDSAAFAERLGVPIHETPFDGVAGAPFEFRKIRRWPVWREVALWWPETRTLVAADALGSLGYFGPPLGVHPIMRPTPPRRALAGLTPEHVLVGHGEGVHGPEAAPALAHALATARTGFPRLIAGGARRAVRRS